MSAQILLMYSSGMARYLIPLLPPIVLLTFFRSTGKPFHTGRSAAVPWIAATFAAAILLSVADFRTAQMNRDMAQFMGQTLNGWKSETRFGGEWGFRYYMAQQGFRQFTSTSDDMAGGEFILLPTEAVPYNLAQDVDSMLIPVLDRIEQSSFPVRLMNRAAHAGFYSSSWGLLPFSISRSPLEQIKVKQVSYLVEKLPEIKLNDVSATDVIIPSPAAGGGVDVAVPAPSRMSIPYAGPIPAHVQFSCIEKETNITCPIQVFYNVDGTQSELALRHKNNFADFELTDRRPGTIELIVKSPETVGLADRLTIRNWIILPMAVQP